MALSSQMNVLTYYQVVDSEPKELRSETEYKQWIEKVDTCTQEALC